MANTFTWPSTADVPMFSPGQPRQQPTVRNYTAGGRGMAWNVPTQPGSPATAGLASLEKIVNEVMDSGSYRQNSSLNDQAIRAVRERLRNNVLPRIDQIESTANDFAAAIAAKITELTIPPAPKDALEAARAAELRAWYMAQGKDQQNVLLQNALSSDDSELLSAIWHAPVAFGLITDQRRRNIAEVIGKANHPNEFYFLGIFQQQVKALREAIIAARAALADMVNFTKAQEDQAFRERAQRDRMILNGIQPHDAV